jgi:hypothetical protein
MEQTTLKYLRIFIPGLTLYIIVQIFYCIVLKKEINEVNFSDLGWPLIISIVLGVLYNSFDIRYNVTNYTHKKIDLNIKNHIINLYNGSLSPNQTQFLFQKNRLKQIFYKIIDNDPSLSIKKNNVFFNGLLWTSFADIFIITLFSSFLFILYGIFGSYETDNILKYSGVLLIISLLSLLMHFQAFLKHVKLSNDQIEFIETNHINTVKELIEKSLNENNVN